MVFQGGKKFPPKCKPKPLPKQVPPVSSLAASSEGDQELENQLELELCWCIEQLQLGLHSGKLSEKQALDSTKTIHLLQNDSVAWIRKRQVMSNTFGDYRAKMREDEKKHGNYLAKYKFIRARVDRCVHLFLKKAATEPAAGKTFEENGSSDTEDPDKNNVKKPFVMSKRTSAVPFTFNFTAPEPE